MIKNILLLIVLFTIHLKISAQNSVARRWNEVQIEAIRQDLARPPVQARNLYHVSMAMYDAWAAYDKKATTYLLGKTINGTLFNYNGVPPMIGNDTTASRQMAISYAAYRVLKNRYAVSPNVISAYARFDTLMNNLGYDINITSTNYIGATPAEFGNYIAQQVISMGINDGARQSFNYNNGYYLPMNPLLIVDSIGTRGMINPNRWQPLKIFGAVDQNNNPIASNQVALCHEWGNVIPFSMDPSSAVGHFRSGNIYYTYKDPGGPSLLDTSIGNDASSIHYKWANEMVAIWATFHTPDDTTMLDISPNSRGNLAEFPVGLYNQYGYYNYFNGGDTSHGYSVNPATGLPYTPQVIKRGDYTRVISQYWADGPQSETPPGHWYVIFNNVSNNPLLVKQFEGQGDTLSDLDWDIKGYFTLGGAVHDAAIAAWSLKGWYDSPRPISAIRRMCEYGQCTNPFLPSYHKAGIDLIPGYIELITATDSMAIADSTNLNKIKIKNWLGFSKITNAATDYAGVGWTLGEKWIPYQRKGFVTPPFAGYVSGHSTYSRAGAEVMTKITGTPYFPGGLYETLIPANSNFLQFEKGPSTDVTLQWATYRDASNEASLSRIYGGIHPSTDDATGRIVGEAIGVESVNMARSYFNSSFLPVTLIYFNGINNHCKNNIMWSTSDEKNILRYEVWKSENGTEYTIKIGDINANGNRNTIENYSITDGNINTQNFYELIEVDLDGKRTILAHTSVKGDNCTGNELASNGFSIYPIPANENISIQYITKHEETGKIKIIDVLGNILYQSKVFFNEQNKSNSLNINSLPTGNYFVQLTTEDGVVYSAKMSKN